MSAERSFPMKRSRSLVSPVAHSSKQRPPAGPPSPSYTLGPVQQPSSNLPPPSASDQASPTVPPATASQLSTVVSSVAQASKADRDLHSGSAEPPCKVSPVVIAPIMTETSATKAESVPVGSSTPKAAADMSPIPGTSYGQEESTHTDGARQRLFADILSAPFQPTGEHGSSTSSLISHLHRDIEGDKCQLPSSDHGTSSCPHAEQCSLNSSDADRYSDSHAQHHETPASPHPSGIVLDGNPISGPDYPVIIPFRGLRLESLDDLSHRTVTNNFRDLHQGNGFSETPVLYLFSCNYTCKPCIPL